MGRAPGTGIGRPAIHGQQHVCHGSGAGRCARTRERAVVPGCPQLGLGGRQQADAARHAGTGFDHALADQGLEMVFGGVDGAKAQGVGNFGAGGRKTGLFEVQLDLQEHFALPGGEGAHRRIHECGSSVFLSSIDRLASRSAPRGHPGRVMSCVSCAWQVPDSAMTRPEGDSSSGTQKKLQSHIVAMRNRSRALSVLFACKSGVHSGSPTAQPPHCVAAISLHIVPPGFLIRRLRFSFRSRAVRCGCSRPGRLRQRESRAGQIPFPAAKWFSLFQRLPSSLALALYRS